MSMQRLGRPFAAGVVYETMCSLWVGEVARHNVALSGAAGFACALAVAVGLTDAAKTRGGTLAYALGCGVGAMLGTWFGRGG